ncbi:FCS-Like Zinc finger 17-like [Primulina tabacum]|uniref:FCS-Like Zinc finger 17-like n=1 Tax=Primulina tabacum TaxID=48773 RepID=UPI003F5A895E
MVGLSVILENFKEISTKKSPQVIVKGSAIKPPSNPSSPSILSPLSGFSPWTKNTSTSGFLEYCFLCKQKLSPSKDLYMYKGDRAFCSVECRCRQIFMDEEESDEKAGGTKEYNCSLAAMKGPLQVPHQTSSPSSSRSGKRARIHWFT